MTIPTTTFTGVVKQMSEEGLTAQGEEILGQYFPCFRELESPWRVFAGEKATHVISAVGGSSLSTGRLRRYAGGRSLERGRYFSICSDEYGDDGGTLVHELEAYAQSPDGFGIAVLDSTLGSNVDLIEKLLNGEEVPYPRFLLLCVFPVEEDNQQCGPADLVTYRLDVVKATIENTLDLRLRQVQDWFCETFVELECRAGRRATGGVMTLKEPLRDFSELLPSLLTLGRGGNDFHDSVGRWLRGHEINALIYPSARAEVFVKSRGRTIEDSGGWNLVLYAGAEPTEDDEASFGLCAKWAEKQDVAIRAIHWEDDGQTRYWHVYR